ncbi:YecA family protein [Psychrobacter sp. ASPA161_9]|uniref:YecA family protein n=1 Tax=Psychrobacter sp. ASPA161_9 TaxID=3160961 RepID=UPI003F81EEF0
MFTFDINEIRKLGRNDKCWCGSNLKFKRCHKDREREQPISKGEVIQYEQNISKREACYAPQELKSECTNIIKAHTVSKSSGLSDIADNTNHVLGLKQNLVSFQKSKGKLRFERVGINKASTFRGFCAKHDKQLFSCFEDIPFIGTQEQCTALTYRSVAKEIYAKENALDVSGFIKKMDQGKPLIFQINIQEHNFFYQLGLEAAINELYTIKNDVDSELLSKGNSSYNFLVIESSSPIPVVVSSVINPTQDFNGKPIQDLSDLSVKPEYLVFNAFSSAGKGFVVFSWLKKAKIIDRFIQSLLSIDNSEMYSYLVNFFFSSAENSFISPSWWEYLSDIQRSKIEELFNIGSDSFVDVPRNVLADNNVKFTGWYIDNIYRV